MKSISETNGELAWVQASAWKRDCDLHDGHDVVATLRWQRAFQASAIGETVEGIWRFKLEGFLFRQWVRIERRHGARELQVRTEFQRRSRVRRRPRVLLEMDTSFIAQPEIPLMTLLGWYPIMLLSDIRPG